MICTKTAVVDGKLTNVLTEQEYSENYKLYENNQNMYANSAIEVTTKSGDYILPFRNKTDNLPGIYSEGFLYFVREPVTEDDMEKYKSSNIDVTDLRDSKSIEDFMSKTKIIKDMEMSTLSGSDDVFIPPLLEEDTPEMRAFKEAVALKQCDINKYSQRFGDNFLNDKRIFKTGSVTMNKLISISKNLDMEVELVLRDASDTVPNRMGKEVRVILTGDQYDNEQL